MKLTLEISMYPLQSDYIPHINDFIAKLHSYAGLRITTNATSTLVIGDYDAVMAMLAEMLRWSHERHGRAVFVAKFIPNYDPV